MDHAHVRVLSTSANNLWHNHKKETIHNTAVSISDGIYGNCIAFMMTLENGNAFHITGPSRGGSNDDRRMPVMRSIDVFFDVISNKLLN